MIRVVSTFLFVLHLRRIACNDCPNPFRMNGSYQKVKFQFAKYGTGSAFDCSMKCTLEGDACLGISSENGKWFYQLPHSYSSLELNWLAQSYQPFQMKFLRSDNKGIKMANFIDVEKFWPKMKVDAIKAGFDIEVTFTNQGKPFKRMYQKHQYDNGVNYQFAERKCAQSGAHLPVVYDSQNAEELLKGLGINGTHIPVGLKIYEKRTGSNEYLVRWSNGMLALNGKFSDLNNRQLCKDIKVPNDPSVEFCHYEKNVGFSFDKDGNYQDFACEFTGSTNLLIGQKVFDRSEVRSFIPGPGQYLDGGPDNAFDNDWHIDGMKNLGIHARRDIGQAWIAVDLGKSYYLKMVYFQGRGDGYVDRLNGARFYFCNEFEKPTSESGSKKFIVNESKCPLCGEFKDVKFKQVGHIEYIYCPRLMQGRYLLLQVLVVPNEEGTIDNIGAIAFDAGIFL